MFCFNMPEDADATRRRLGLVVEIVSRENVSCETCQIWQSTWELGIIKFHVGSVAIKCNAGDDEMFNGFTVKILLRQFIWDDNKIVSLTR